MQNQRYPSNGYSVLEKVTIRHLWPFIGGKICVLGFKKNNTFSNTQKTKRFLNILFLSSSWQKTMKFYPQNEVADVADDNLFM